MSCIVLLSSRFTKKTIITQKTKTTSTIKATTTTPTTIINSDTISQQWLLHLKSLRCHVLFYYHHGLATTITTTITTITIRTTKATATAVVAITTINKISFKKPSLTTKTKTTLIKNNYDYYNYYNYQAVYSTVLKPWLKLLPFISLSSRKSGIGSWVLWCLAYFFSTSFWDNLRCCYCIVTIRL